MPIPFTPPLADIRFVLSRLIGFADMDMADAVLDEAGKIAAEKFAPLNEIGDRQGLKFTDGKITMPPGFREAYQAYVDGGWNGLPVEEEFGGQNLPWLLAMSVNEMMQAANIGLALCGLLNQGAIELLSVHGDEAIKTKYLPRMVSGEWAATMNLTEPQAGSDVGAVKTKAIKADNHYRISGQKIFISYGDHDLTTNIMHLVLARLPDAPEGTRGLSLFLVPKILVNEDGSLGTLNDVRVVSIEHKLGQHSSPTCVMAYGDNEGAIGYLVGSEGGGIAAMFTMMNNARISVGVQGLGVMERAYQQARDFAKTRIQSRPIENNKAHPVTIINHPDVRRMLMVMKSSIEASRALAYSCGHAVDVAKLHEDESQRKAAAARVDVLTPIVKAWLTDLANEVTSTGVQIFGGMGYIEETGAAQHMRDARILAIYEGTNGIQANDLVFRKLLRDGGLSFALMVAEVDNFLRTLPQNAQYAQMRNALDAMKISTEWFLKNAKENPVIAAASATPFLRLCGNVLGGYYLMRMAVLAQEDLDAGTGDADFLAGKIASAKFFAAHTLPQCAGLAVTITQGFAPTLSILESQF